MILGFLDQAKVNNPLQYVEQICYEDTGFLPVYYFLSLGEISFSEAIRHVSDIKSRKSAKTTLLNRLQSAEILFLKIPTGNNSLPVQKRLFYLDALRNRTLTSDIPATELIYALRAVRSLKRGELDISYICSLLRDWFNQYYTDRSISNGADYIRRAICCVDQVHYMDNLTNLDEVEINIRF